MFTVEVQALVEDPFKGRTAEEVHAICNGPQAAAALAHPAPDFLIEKFGMDSDLSEEELLELFEETKRFLVAGQLLDVSLAPSLPVDLMWHAWILFTMDYHSFSEQLGGYIHHRPIPSGNPDQPPLEPTVEIMEAAYGGPLSEVFWPQELGAYGIMDCKKGP